MKRPPHWWGRKDVHRISLKDQNLLRTKPSPHYMNTAFFHMDTSAASQNSMNTEQLRLLSQALAPLRELDSPLQLSTLHDRRSNGYSTNFDEFNQKWQQHIISLPANSFERRINFTPLPPPPSTQKTHCEKFHHNPKDPFLSTDVRFKIHELETNIQRTYLMCPFCDPMAQDHKPTKIKKFGKRSVQLPARSPLNTFYDTYASGYSNHMVTQHGVMRGFVPREPLIGLVLSDEGLLKLNVVCPYMHPEDSDTPCFARITFNTKDGNGFKSYYRHLRDFHNPNSTKNMGSKGVKRLLPSDTFYPVQSEGVTRAILSEIDQARRHVSVSEITMAWEEHNYGVTPLEYSLFIPKELINISRDFEGVIHKAVGRITERQRGVVNKKRSSIPGKVTKSGHASRSLFSSLSTVPRVSPRKEAELYRDLLKSLDQRTGTSVAPPSTFQRPTRDPGAPPRFEEVASSPESQGQPTRPVTPAVCRSGADSTFDFGDISLLFDSFS